MELKKALSILNLNYNCTEEDLKKAYRNLVKRYHPDNYQEETIKVETSKKMQTLNEANDVVKEYLKTINIILNPNKDNSNNVKFTTLMQLLEQEILQELEYISKIPYDNDKNFLMYGEKFRYLVYNVFYSNIKKATDVEHLRKIYSAYKVRYNELIQAYCIDLGMAIGLNPVDFYNCILTKNQILTLKEFRDKALEIINNILDSELTKYKEIEDYNVLEPLLTAIRQTHALTCLWGQFDINTTKKELKKHLMFTINKYYKRKKLLEELIEADGEILPHSIELQNVILSEKEFYNLYNQIDKPSKAKSLARKIAKHFNQKTKKQIEK